MKKIFDKISSPGESAIKSAAKLGLFLLTRPGISFLLRKAGRLFKSAGLVKEHDLPLEEWLAAQERDNDASLLTERPLVSILIDIDDTSLLFFEATLKDIFRQTYTEWELIVYCPDRYEELVRNRINDVAHSKNTITLITGSNISRAGIFARLSAETKGTYMLFPPKAGALRSNALLEFIKHINTSAGDELIYADELVMRQGNEPLPYFKPGWSPDALMSRNYIGEHFLIRKKLFDLAGGINAAYPEHFLYDLLLRASEKTVHIGRVPHILFNVKQSGIANEEQKQIIEAALERRGTPGHVIADPSAEGVFFIDHIITRPGKVSIIIPTKDNVALLKTTIDSIFGLTHYKDYEIILLNNNSTSPEFFSLVAEYKIKHPEVFKCIAANFPFNFSKLINFGVAESTGEYILMLNNDVEVLQDDWLERMVGYVQLPHIGAVGVKLLFPDETIQHVGVVLGVGDAASHSFINMPKETDVYFNYIRSVNNCSAVTAACLMIRREVFEQVKGMDEALPVEFNDVDFCLKVRQHGYYNVYIPSVELYHYESATRGHPFRSIQAWEQHEHDLNYFKEKWGDIINNDPFYNPNLSVEYTDHRQKKRMKT